MAINNAIGRAGRVGFTPAGNSSVEIVGITQFIRDLAKSDQRFKKEANKASTAVANLLVVAAKFEAASVTRSRQATEVMKGMRARTFNSLPAAVLSEKSAFQSSSRKFTSARSDNGRRVRRKVTRGDVFFGAEFGGARNKNTKQFLRHRGKSGYFFWPTVRKHKKDIAKEYLDAIDRVYKTLEDARAQEAAARKALGGVYSQTDTGIVFIPD
jgi:hypothetical protein